MTYLDVGILNAVEWLCHKFQRLTGRTNVWLAAQVTNLTIVMYFVWAAMYFWNTEFSVRLSVGLFCGALLYVLPQTVFKVSIEEYENNAYRRVAKGVRNPRRIRDALLRISFLRCRSCSCIRCCSCTSTRAFPPSCSSGSAWCS